MPDEKAARRSAPKVATEYEAITDQINPLIARAEKALAGLRLGVTASVPLGSDEGYEHYLTFGKADKEWVLTLEVCQHDGQPWTTKRLHTASREWRLIALKALPELKEALHARAQTELTAARETVEQATAYLNTLEKEGLEAFESILRGAPKGDKK